MQTASKSHYCFAAGVINTEKLGSMTGNPAFLNYAAF
jgi:hypothetical protein